jgi:glutaredoxin 3
LSEQTNNKTDTTEIVIYTQALCGYCIAAKKLLRSKGVDFTEINVTMNAVKRRKMIDRCGQNTVPQIFINDHHIGGYDDMAELDRHDELDALLGRI